MPPKALGSLDSTEERIFKKKINLSHSHLCVSVSKSIQFQCFALIYVPRTAKLFTHVNFSFTRSTMGLITFRFLYFFHHSQTNMAASENLSEREREGLARTSPLVYLHTSEGTTSGFIHQNYHRFGETMYILSTGISNICCVYSNIIINLYSPHIQPLLNSTFEDVFFPASRSGLEFQICCG